MSEIDHKLDHKLRVSPSDHIGHLHEYDLDLQSNHIYLMGVESYATDDTNEPGVEYRMANRFIKNLNLCMRANPDKPVIIHMKSCGGDVTEGMAIYDAIKSCPFPVTVLNYTHASSMSSVIFQAANKRVMMPHSYFLFHEFTVSHEGTFRQIISSVNFDKLSMAQMIDIYENALKRSGKFSKRSRKWIRNWLNRQMSDKTDVILTAKEAVEIGFADYVFDYNWEKLTDYTEEELARG